MKILVTGGGGFLGQNIIKQLLAQGHKIVSMARNNYPALSSLGVDVRRGDITDLVALQQAAHQCDAIIHVAAKAGLWGNYEEYYRINVLGTENVIKTCLLNKIDKLVFTSSPSAIYDGKDLVGVNESISYPKYYLSYYAKTKAIAEQKVLAANGRHMATVALRPHLIWGPGDNHILPGIIKRARAGTLTLLGNQDYLVDTVYVDNAAKAHLLALEKLTINASIAGKAYFISQDNPITIQALINKFLQVAKLPTIKKVTSPKIAYVIACVIEGCYRIAKIKNEPPLTRYMVKQLSTNHWFDITAAKTDLGYEPTISIDEGMKRLEQWVNDHHHSI